MATPMHTERMEMLVVFTFLILAGVLSVLSHDSRDFDDTDRRGWWPGRR
jgi:hypothetical protein